MKGFTLLSLMMTVTIIGILAIIAAPVVFGPVDCHKQTMGWITKAKVNAAIGDIGIVKLAIERQALAGVKYEDMNLGLDRWGNRYQFLDHSTVEGNGPKRKAWSNVPVNTHYDLYSMGPDGDTATPMTSTPGGDDIVIAGQYIGVACFYPKPNGG